jgi:hypothetical protein
MSSLRDTQAAFCAAVLSDDVEPMRRLVHENGIPAEHRLQIYRNNNRLGTLAALQATYPVVERLGGADWFHQSALRYMRACPSRSGDLQGRGARYPEFLRADLAAAEYAYFADVAALEWAYQSALTAAERPPVDIEVLRGVAPDDYERLLFVPRPAVGVVESPYPIFAIWRSNQPSAIESDEQIRLDAGASRVLLIRRRDHVELREISPGTSGLLRQFQRGALLGSAAAATAAAWPAFDLDASLRELVELEVIAEIRLGNFAENLRVNR